MIYAPLKKSALALLLMMGFTTTVFADSDSTRRVMNPKDPYEPFNRVVYHFNDLIDHAILKPIATLYNKIVPKPVVKGVANMYQNIDTIPTVVNDVLQFNFYQATSDAWRLGLNSTIGILGFFDVAADMGLEPNVEDFGLTLAQWGYKNSNYLVLPFFGPSSLRDAIGLPVDYYAFSIYPHIYPTMQRYEIYGLGVISRRAELLSYENVMEEAALDRYVFLRDAYMQRRAYQIQRNTELGDPYLEKNIKDKAQNENQNLSLDQIEGRDKNQDQNSVQGQDQVQGQNSTQSQDQAQGKASTQSQGQIQGQDNNQDKSKDQT